MSAWSARLYTVEWANKPKLVQNRHSLGFHSWLNPIPMTTKADIKYEESSNSFGTDESFEQDEEDEEEDEEEALEDNGSSNEDN